MQHFSDGLFRLFTQNHHAVDTLQADFRQSILCRFLAAETTGAYAVDLAFGCVYFVDRGTVSGMSDEVLTKLAKCPA